MCDERDKNQSETDESGKMSHDPRPVSDSQLREEVSREEVEGYRESADQSHSNWFSVMNNPYGKD
ncbi:MAG: hypothetical protein RI539_00690 [Spiribacter sp.]|jgi:hypothetical protein|nr:hypothetical protein [Spiribacter sp.]MDR9488842.1 hypothetical protein [Spiribacter sp.]